MLDLAKRAGMNMDVGATPAIALGAADATPIEVAGAYTMFANRGVASKPNWIRMIRSHKGAPIFDAQPQRKAVLDPRVNYLMVSLMQEVMRSGTAAGVRVAGFTLPAAGKTGTSRDGWFAGFTSKLVCVVWVGFDDGKDLNLEGAKSALPIWTEFMKRAHQRREYRNVQRLGCARWNRECRYRSAFGTTWRPERARARGPSISFRERSPWRCAGCTAAVGRR